MSKTTARVTISAPNSVVFDVLTDFAGRAEVLTGVERVEVISTGAHGKWRETRTMMGGQETVEMAVSDLIRPSRLVILANAHGTAYQTTYRAEPAENGTLLIAMFEARPQTFLAKLLAPLGMLAIGSVQRQMDADLADIAKAAEARAAG